MYCHFTRSDARARSSGIDFDPADDVLAVQKQARHRGLRWLLRHGHLDAAAVHIRDTPEHAGGRSVDASVNLPAWDRQGLERLVRYCARPPLSQERLGRLNDETLVYRLRKPTVDGRMELILTPLELLDRLSKLVTPPRLHKHRYCGVLAPNARLRKAVIERLEDGGQEEAEPRSRVSRLATPYHSWERGSNENFNGLLRQYLPKRKSQAHITQRDCDALARKLNNRPRKRLGYRTPEEAIFGN